MHVRVTKLAAIAGSAALLAMASTLPAAAANHGKVHRWRARHHYHHRYDRPLTVTARRHRAPVVAAPDPYHGPAAIITGPNAVAATIVALPFRVAGSVFPAYGDSPLVLIGAPIHVAAQVAEFPFYAVGTVFGAPPNVVY